MFWQRLALAALLLAVFNVLRVLTSHTPIIPLIAAVSFAVGGVACLVQARKEKQ